jgi:amidophosphoribosyltransferase
MKRVVAELRPGIQGFEVSCFEGHYLTGDISQADFDGMRELR